jgi:hypothetical protein
MPVGLFRRRKFGLGPASEIAKRAYANCQCWVSASTGDIRPEDDAIVTFAGDGHRCRIVHWPWPPFSFFV